MNRFWNRRRTDSDLEAELRANRPEPPPELIARLAARTGVDRRLHVGGLRVGVAGGLSLLMLVGLGAVGGIGYAASAVTEAMTEVKGAVAQGPSTVSTSAGQDQYKPGKGCGDKNHEHEREFQCKVKINDAKVKEGNSGTTPLVFTVSADDTAIDPVTVAYTTANGTATAPSDYQPAAGVLTILAGTTSATITVNVVGDLVREPSETLTVTLFNVSANAVIIDDTGIGTIQNDD
jgi:hypothetical protein